MQDFLAQDLSGSAVLADAIVGTRSAARGGPCVGAFAFLVRLTANAEGVRTMCCEFGALARMLRPRRKSVGARIEPRVLKTISDAYNMAAICAHDNVD